MSKVKWKAVSGLVMMLLLTNMPTLASNIQPAITEPPITTSQEPPATQWTQTYGGTDNENAESVVQTSDGGYAIAGLTDSGAGGWDFWLVRADAAGNELWNKTYGGTSYEIAWSVVQTVDGGYALAGYTGSFGAAGLDFWWVKTDFSGIVQWNKTYGGKDTHVAYSSDIAYSLVQTVDGGYAIAGYTGADDSNFWLVKTDASGNPQWNKTYGGAGNEWALSVIQTSDGGYALTGFTNSSGAGSADFWLVKTDFSGVVQWNKTYGGTAYDYAFSVIQTSDEGYALAGYGNNTGASCDLWLVKTDSSGNMIWSKTFGEAIDLVPGQIQPRERSVVQMSDGGYAMAADKGSYATGLRDFWLVRTDSTGDMLWNETYGGEYGESARSLVHTSDGGYAIAGTTGSYGAGNGDFWLVKTAPEGDLYITSIEPIQVILDAEALMMNKDTVVQVTIVNEFSERKWADIQVIYDFGSKSYIETGPAGLGVPLDPGLNRIYIPGGPAFPAQAEPWVSANQPPWLEWTTVGSDSSVRAIVDPYGKVSETKEDNNERVATAKVMESGPLKILCVPVYFPLIGQSPFDPQTDDQAKFMLAIYPVARNKFRWTQSPSIPWLRIPPETNLEDWLYWNASIPITIMTKILGYDRAVIVIQDLGQDWSGIAVGMPRTPENRVPVVVDSTKWREGTVAHEIGHTYYLMHPNDVGPPVYDAERFWVATRNYEQEMNTLMSYSWPRWIDKGRFDNDTRTWVEAYGTWRWNLFDQLKIGMDPEIIVARGVIFRNSTVKADEPWFRIPEGMPDLLPGTTGNYSMVLVDEQSQVLSQLGFNASFTYFLDINGTLTETNADSVPFIFSIPYVDNTHRIEIRNATNYVLVDKLVSPNLPTATMIFPNGGEIFAVGTNYTITWEANDLDENPLTYSLAYSKDAGENWIPLAIDLQASSYVWDTSQLASGSDYLMKVIVNDGVNTGEDVSDGTLSVTIQGDINGDFAVNVSDLSALGRAYDTTPGSPSWNRNADINNDLIINVIDLELLRKNYGRVAW